MGPIIKKLERKKHIEERNKSKKETQNETKGETKGEKGEKKVVLKITEVNRPKFKANEYKKDENCEKIIENAKDMNVDSTGYNKYKTCIEKTNKERLKENEIPELYPHLDDEDFSKKIYLKKEFNETKY